MNRPKEDCPFSKILYDEHLLTTYSALESSNATCRLKNSKLFGNFKIATIKSPLALLAAAGIAKRPRLLSKVVRQIFKNRGRTSWSIDSTKYGARRLYPSNGGLHALRPRTTIGNTSIEYFPDTDEFVTFISNRSKNDILIEIILDLPKIIEKYRDVSSLAAVYIELGHALTVLDMNVTLDNALVSLTEFEQPSMPGSVTIARIHLDNL